jgi:hypothetical protein
MTRYLKNDDGVVDTRFGVLYVANRGEDGSVSGFTAKLMPGDHPSDRIHGDRLENSLDTVEWEYVCDLWDDKPFEGETQSTRWANEGVALLHLSSFMAKIEAGYAAYQEAPDSEYSVTLSLDEVLAAHLLLIDLNKTE